MNLLTRISLLTLCGIVALSTSAANAQEEKITFDDHAKPIFKQRCARCHSPDKKSGGLDLTNFTNMMQGGSSGSSVEPGDSQGSYLYSLITHEDEPAMPPGNNKIPENEIQLLAKWIDQGALETKTSVARITKPSISMAVGENPNARPETAPRPGRLSKEPAIHTRRPSNATSIATNPWAPIAAIGVTQQVLLYDTSTMRLLGVLPFPEGSIYQLQFSRNGSVLIAGGGKDGASGLVVGWDVRSGERVFAVGDELDVVMAADISNDHTKIALGGTGKRVKVYSTEDGSLLYEIKKHTEWVTAIEFSPDASLLATGDRNGGLYVWETETGQEHLTLKGHTDQIAAVAWRTDGQTLASASQDATARTWEMENGKQLKSWQAHAGGATDVDFTREGQILTSGRDKTVRLWKQDGSAIHAFGGLVDIAIACAYCNESKRVIGSDWSGLLRIWNAADKAHLGDMETNPAPLAARVQQAQQQLDAASNELAALQKRSNQLNANMSKKVAAINQQSTETAAIEQQLATAKSSFAAKQQEMQAITADQANKQNQLASRRAALASLRESLQNANQAAQQLPKDEGLKKVAASLGQKVTQLESQIAQQKQSDVAAKQRLKELRAERESLQPRIAEQEARLAQLASRLSELQNAKQALQPKFDDQKAKLAAATAKRDRAKTELTRWKSEQQFTAQLKSLYDQLQGAENEFIRATETVTASGRALDQAKSAQTAAQKRLEALQQKIHDTRGEKH